MVRALVLPSICTDTCMYGAVVLVWGAFFSPRSLRKLPPLRPHGKIELILNKVLKHYHGEGTLKGKETCGEHGIAQVLLFRWLKPADYKKGGSKQSVGLQHVRSVRGAQGVLCPSGTPLLMVSSLHTSTSAPWTPSAQFGPISLLGPKDGQGKEWSWGNILLSSKYTVFRIYFLLLFQLLDTVISLSLQITSPGVPSEWSTF